ncbi:MAG: arginine--tRNA ligase [Bacteroidales bacterium]|jgi:arginyl-tRNA synthetase|nr:arginine--tRNA ligase [Bacteroidales bacterium]
MQIELTVKNEVVAAIKAVYQADIAPDTVQIEATRKDFEGDLTVVVFPLLRYSRTSPENTATAIGQYLADNLDLIASFDVFKGFLNLKIVQSYWLAQLKEAAETENYGFVAPTADAPLVMIEYSSPNTNKPLHLGHIRNNLLGWSLAEILKANGFNVVKTNIVNDRGIHICKSMYAWQQWGDGKTPESAGIKGDHLVGDCYVLFDKHYKQEIRELTAAGRTPEEAEQQAPSMCAARELLRKWEAKDPDTVALWKRMNQWVYDGFDITYRELGIDFDKIYYESQTYLEGKAEVLRGLNAGLFEQEPDGSVWADLTADGLDRKILLRSDGTSVYMTQDIGTAKLRFNDFPIDRMIYVVGNEQNYHFQVLATLLDRLGFKWGKTLFHFSYGMVELPSGKMKSREGTVVDADDLLADMVKVARKTSEELGKLDGYSDTDAEKTYRMIALGALKYFILKVDPKKNMLFNPEESIDFNGNTGPFIQYAHARICSVLRKATEQNISLILPKKLPSLLDKERNLLKTVTAWPQAVREAGTAYSPALIANYIYNLVKEFNQFYHDYSILSEPDTDVRAFRLVLSAVVARIIRSGMWLLGIESPERM